MGCIGTPPDSDYARHVLQVNMKLHALSGVPVPPGVAPYKSLNNRSLLLYSQPQFPTCVAVPVPLMTALQLATVLDGPMSIVSRLRAAVGTGTDKRVLLNIAWSFPRERESFELHPFFLTVDTEHGTNSKKMQAFTVCGRDRDNRNILAVKGFLCNLKVPAFVFLFVKGLPHCLSVRSLLCTNAICLDGSKEQWSGFRVSVSVGVFNPHIMEIICYFHKVIQEMRDGSNLGISNVHPVVYSRIAVCLGYISQTYRLVAHAKKAMACLREYGKNALIPSKVSHVCSKCPPSPLTLLSPLPHNTLYFPTLLSTSPLCFL